jgi:hypothetical protein
MKFSIFKLFTLMFCFLSMGLHADNEVRDNATGTVFPSEVSFDHDGKQYQLQATGVATRKKFFVKVYAVASYLEKASDNPSGDKFQPFLRDGKAKQLTMKWVHEASVGKVQEGYHESFKKALNDQQLNQLQSQIDTFVRFFNQDVQKGDEHVIRSVPGGYVEVLINGNKVGSVSNPDFANALWSIWFGSNSVVDRNNLVSLMK